MTFPRTRACEPSPIGSVFPVAKPVANLIFVVAMAAVIVAVDVLVFRHHIWERLAANVGIVLVFVAFYFRFLRHS